MARGRTSRRANLAICSLLLVGVKLSHVGLALAATHDAHVETLGANLQLQERLPQAQAFTVEAAGQVRITLSDLAAPQPFAQLQLLVSRDGDKVLAMIGAGAQQFAATPGDYAVQVVGTPAAGGASGAPAGTFSVEVRELNGNTVLRQFADGIAALPQPPTAQSTFSAQVQIPAAGTYNLTFHDRSMPAALTAIDVGLFAGSDRLVTIPGPCSAPAGCVAAFQAGSAGTYTLLVAATAAAPHEAGLYSLGITGPGGTAYATTQPVGRLDPPESITLPGAGTYTFDATDHETPAALTTLKFRLMQGATLLAALDAPGSVPAAAAAGTVQLFAFERPAGGPTGNTGVYSFRLSQGAQSIHRGLRTLPHGFDAAINAAGFVHEFDVATTASYRLRLRDMNFPTPLTQLRAVVVPASGTVQSVSGTDIDSTFQLAAGRARLALIGSTSGPGANSLLGVSLAPVAGGAALLDRTQGIGPLFSTHTLVIPAAGSYDVSIRDLHFPAAFQEFAVALSRGTEIVGQAFGTEKIRFNAQPGTYSLNLLARPAAAAQYASWGFGLSNTPPVPVVTLSATPATVQQGGTTTLNWSATGATSCAATGGWSGARALTGSEASAAITADTTYTLSCAGDGGSTSQSVTVVVAAPEPERGGGGAAGLATLLALAGLLGVRRMRNLLRLAARSRRSW